MKISKILSIVIISLLVSNTFANNRYNNYQGQGVWFSESGMPLVEVTIKGAYVYAHLRDQKVLPAVKLKSINSELLNEYTEKFILLQDYNADDFNDVAVLKSVGYGGANRCYSVFEYVPSVFSYRSRSTKTVCVK